jgi:hypothetical protein
MYHPPLALETQQRRIHETPKGASWIQPSQGGREAGFAASLLQEAFLA